MNEDSYRKLSLFFDKHQTIHCKKRETLLRVGDTPQGVYFLKKGFVRLYSICEEGKELTLVIYKPGDFFPVVWSFSGGKPSIYSFETYAPAELKRAPREAFMEFIKGNLDVFFEVTQHIIRRFQIALRRMEYLTFGRASSKIASVLLICGSEFGVKKKGLPAGRQGEIEIQIPFIHKDLADLVGLTRETVSLELKKFDRRELIGYNQKLIVIKSPEGLQKFAIL